MPGQSRRLDCPVGDVGTIRRRVRPRVTGDTATGGVSDDANMDAPDLTLVKATPQARATTEEDTTIATFQGCRSLALPRPKTPPVANSMQNGVGALPSPADQKHCGPSLPDTREADAGPGAEARGDGVMDHDGVDVERRSMANGASEMTQVVVSGVRDPAVNVVEDAKKLAQSLAVVKMSLSAKQLEDLDLVLNSTLNDVRGLKRSGFVGRGGGSNE